MLDRPAKNLRIPYETFPALYEKNVSLQDILNEKI